MKLLLLPFFCLSFFSQLVWCLSSTSCQSVKPEGEPALKGCPAGTIYVSPTDPEANFTTIQGAIDSAQNGNPNRSTLIFVGAGRYFEMLNVTRGSFVLLGQVDRGTASGNAWEYNLVEILNNRSVNGGWSDLETATLTIGPPSGGTLACNFYNLNFTNIVSFPIEPALVIAEQYAFASFYGCSFSSIQDTIFVGENAFAYFVRCIIYGRTDYLFGLGTAWFQSVTLANRGCGGGITAWSGTPGTTKGVYIADSNIIRSPDADEETYRSCFLGRPWNNYSTAIFLRNLMGDCVAGVGFVPWTGEGDIPSTTKYVESGSYGLGGNTSHRCSADEILSEGKAARYTLSYVFGGDTGWIDLEWCFGCT